MSFFSNLIHYPDRLITIIIVYLFIYFFRNKIGYFFNSYFYVSHKGYKYLLEKNYEYIILNNNIDNVKKEYEENVKKNLSDYIDNIEQFYNIKIENLKLSLYIIKYVNYIRYIYELERKIIKNLNDFLKQYCIQIYSAIFD